MRNRMLVVLAMILGTACQGRIAPLAAQAGSTVIVPLDGNYSGLLPNSVVGYGGSAAADPQRGTLVYRLARPDTGELVLDASGEPIELDTRVSSLVAAHPATPLAVGTVGAAQGMQLVSVVDIPSDAPLGTFELSVVRRYPTPDGTAENAFRYYNGSITILPQSISFETTNGTVVSQGAPTPLEGFVCLFGACGWSPVASVATAAVPLPQLAIDLAPGVWSAQLEIEYQPAAMDVIDAFDRAASASNHRGAVWAHDDENGLMTVWAAGQNGPIGSLSVVFELQTGALPIAAEDCVVRVLKATDEDGNAVSVVPTLRVL